MPVPQLYPWCWMPAHRPAQAFVRTRGLWRCHPPQRPWLRLPQKSLQLELGLYRQVIKKKKLVTTQHECNLSCIVLTNLFYIFQLGDILARQQQQKGKKRKNYYFLHLHISHPDFVLIKQFFTFCRAVGWGRWWEWVIRRTTTNTSAKGNKGKQEGSKGEE